MASVNEDILYLEARLLHGLLSEKFSLSQVELLI